VSGGACPIAFVQTGTAMVSGAALGARGDSAVATAAPRSANIDVIEAMRVRIDRSPRNEV
jgi:hypothetical protein